MSKPRRPWTLLPHSPIEKIDDNLWAVENAVPGLGIMRRMTIVRRSDGSLLFHNAIPLDDASLAAVRAFGTPRYLVVPHDQHAIDAHGFQEHLKLEAFCPKVNFDKCKERVELAGTVDQIPPDAAVRVVETAGTKHGEPVMFATSGDGARVSFIATDLFQHHPPDRTKLMFRMLGFSGARTPPMFKLLFMKDKATLRAELQSFAATPNLTRIVPTHGPVIDDNAAGVLSAAAAQL